MTNLPEDAIVVAADKDEGNDTDVDQSNSDTNTFNVQVYAVENSTLRLGENRDYVEIISSDELPQESCQECGGNNNDNQQQRRIRLKDSTL